VLRQVIAAPAGTTATHLATRRRSWSARLGHLGTAKEVPGTAALNRGGNAGIESVSCASAGNCGAGGVYKDAAGHEQAFVVSETRGSWGTAKEVRGTASLNAGGYGGIFSVSCASAGNCSAGGDYLDASGHEQVFVVSESGGTWGTAKEVPGTAALNAGGYANMDALSCASVGNCSAGGLYKNASGHGQAFIVSQTGGTWGTAEEVPGTVALNKGKQAELQSVSCAPAGNCSAGGFYTDAGGRAQAFVVHQT
jgi:hypothetical protein